MKLTTYITALFPRLRKDIVLDDIRNTRVELVTSTLPAFTVATQLLGKWKWKSEEMQGFAASFGQLVAKGSMFETIEAGLKGSEATLMLAEMFVTKTYNEEISAEALTFRKASVLQFIEAVAFVSRFARKLANMALVVEAIPYAEDGETFMHALQPGEVKWISENFVSFCTMFHAVSAPVKSIEETFEAIPDIVIRNADFGALKEAVGESKLDPFRFGFVPVQMNPFYRFGKMQAEWQVERFNEAKDELKLVQLRKLRLEKLLAKKPDAALEHEIEYMENRVQGLNARIARMETSYA
ncbi:hypothetical protein [Paraburkholderia adhaesiva]|uniref:hypothetical protein n=1 Tax=Paraburkholderia adhaesiva TaxID=2883244 RepID=UPI001F24BC81|nr:hypothetical protein [Paraburkholderia adhaesiva]